MNKPSASLMSPLVRSMVKNRIVETNYHSLFVLLAGIIHLQVLEWFQ